MNMKGADRQCAETDTQGQPDDFEQSVIEGTQQEDGFGKGIAHGMRSIALGRTGARGRRRTAASAEPNLPAG